MAKAKKLSAKKAPNYNKFLVSHKGQWVCLTLTDSEAAKALSRGASNPHSEAEIGRAVNGMNRNPLVIKGVKHYMVDAFTAGR